MTAPNEYPYGQQIELEWTVTDPHDDYALVNDATTSVTVYKPDGTTATPSFTNPEVGVYRAVIVGNQAGWWEWVPLGAGGGRRRFYVGATP